MLEAVIYIAIGAFVGWNLPQPEWAKNVQLKALNFIKRK